MINALFLRRLSKQDDDEGQGLWFVQEDTAKLYLRCEGKPRGESEGGSRETQEESNGEEVQGRKVKATYEKPRKE
jgi:hypothetical protein